MEVLSWKPKGGAAEDDDLSSGVAVQLREELKRQEEQERQVQEQEQLAHERAPQAAHERAPQAPHELAREAAHEPAAAAPKRRRIEQVEEPARPAAAAAPREDHFAYFRGQDILQKVEVDRSKDEDSPTAVVLDFAGQRMYYTQHHCELNDDLAFYVVVWSLADPLDSKLGGEDAHADMTHLENLTYWLNSIHAQAPNAPVLIVGTKADLVDEETRQARVAEVERSFEGAAFELQAGRFDVLCTSSKEGNGIAQVRDTIAAEMKPHDGDAMAGIKGFGDEIPLGWYNFLRLMQERQSENVKRLPLDECRQIAVQQCGIGKDDSSDEDRELLLMLKVFTDLGLLKHATLHNLRSIVVLDLQWIVDLMTELLCARSIEEKHRQSRTRKVQWRRFRDTGRFEAEKLLPELWPDLTANERQIMLLYAVEYRLCCELPCACSETGLFVVPSHLPIREEEDDASWVPHDDDRLLRFAAIHTDGEWEEAKGFLPDSLFFKLVATLLIDAHDVKDAFRHLHADTAVIDGEDRYMLQHVRGLDASSQKPAIQVTVQGAAKGAGARVVSRVAKALDVLSKEFGVQVRQEVRHRLHGSDETWHAVEKLHKREPAVVSWLGSGAAHKRPHPPGAPSPDAERAASDYPTCLDREFVQKELGWQKQYNRPLITVFEDEARRQGHFDYGKAWAKFTSGQFEYVLNVDSITYRRDKDEAEAMITRILRKASADRPVPSPAPLNGPGCWDFFLSHGQAAAGDQVKTLCLLLRQRGRTVWYDYEMDNRSTEAMEEGVKHSAHFLLFLSGDPS